MLRCSAFRRGDTCGIGAGLDLVNFERRQARLVFGANF
jgi:hypothetical protein